MLEKFDYDVYKRERDDIYNTVEVYKGTRNHIIDLLPAAAVVGLMVAVFVVWEAIGAYFRP
jgi:hypothetical protein